MGNLFSPKVPKKKLYQAGFTLVELILAMVILASLTTGTLLALNPQRQVNKGKDSASQANMQEIKHALEIYYQDKNCYPTATSVFTNALNTSGQWKEGNTIYMKKVPFDGYGRPFVYMTDTSSSCPQWNVLFARLSSPSTNVDICPLKESGCTPVGFDNSWACVTSGSSNCGQISSTAVDGNVIIYPTATPSATPSITVTPTPSGIVDFSVALPASAKPQIFHGTLSTSNPVVGQPFTLKVDTDGYNNPIGIASIKATVTTNSQTNTYDMYLSSGNSQNGGWTATWITPESASATFIIKLDLTDKSGNKSHADVVLR